MAAFVSLLSLSAPLAASAETASSTVAVSATLSARTSLRVSADLLQFDVTDPSRPAVMAVDFAAAARTRPGGEVMLSVEPMRAVGGPGGAADVDSALSFTGEGAAAAGSALDRPAVAGRWVGSGLREGRLVFALRAGASGSYSVPVRFALSAP